MPTRPIINACTRTTSELVPTSSTSQCEAHPRRPLPRRRSDGLTGVQAPRAESDPTRIDPLPSPPGKARLAAIAVALAEATPQQFPREHIHSPPQPFPSAALAPQPASFAGFRANSRPHSRRRPPRYRSKAELDLTPPTRHACAWAAMRIMTRRRARSLATASRDANLEQRPCGEGGAAKVVQRPSSRRLVPAEASPSYTPGRPRMPPSLSAIGPTPQVGKTQLGTSACLPSLSTATSSSTPPTRRRARCIRASRRPRRNDSMQCACMARSQAPPSSRGPEPTRASIPREARGADTWSRRFLTTPPRDG
jgi:hypothetical protein